MALQAGQVARMLRDSSWSRAEIEAWAACKPLVPPDSPMAPRQEAVHNDLVRTVVVPGAGHCVRRDQSARYLPGGRRVPRRGGAGLAGSGRGGAP